MNSKRKKKLPIKKLTVVPGGAPVSAVSSSAAAVTPIWMRALGYGIIVIVALIALAPLNDAKFVSMDDPATISQNKQLLEHPASYWKAPAGGLYVPITYMTWAAVAAIDSPHDPAAFHSLNVFIHIICSLLVAAIVRVLLKRDAPAIAGGLIFAIHPLQVEAVAWASGTKDLLAGMFGLLALLLYILSGKNWRSVLYYAGMISLALALLSKPSAMTIPAIAFAIDWLMLRKSFKRAAISLGPWFAMSAVCAVVAWMAQPAMRAVPPPVWQRPLLVGDSITFYLCKLIAPIRLAVCYGRTPAELAQHGWFYLAWLVPAAIAAVLLLKRRTVPILLCAAGIFVIAPAPMLGLFRFDYQYYSTVADHYVYVAMLGAALAVAWVMDRFPSMTVRGIAFLAFVALGVQTNLQSRIWRDDMTLFSHSVEVAPRGLLSLQNLGNAYASKADWQRAASFYQRALEIQPHHYESAYSLAGTLARLGRTDEALAWFRHYLDDAAALPSERRPATYADDLFTFAETSMRAGKYEDAIQAFQLRLALHPDDWEAQRDLEISRRKLSHSPTTKVESSTP